MSKGDEVRLTFNRGVLSRNALARLDLKRTALAAEEQTNFMPRAFGPMSLRPGLKHLGTTAVPPEEPSTPP